MHILEKRLIFLVKKKIQEKFVENTPLYSDKGGGVETGYW